MNYEPNTTQWKPGDLVIHDCDAKKPELLMRVTGFKAHAVKTRYVSPRLDTRELVNRAEVLHDPQRFGIDTSAAKAGLMLPSDLQWLREKYENAGGWRRGGAKDVYRCLDEIERLRAELADARESYLRSVDQEYAVLRPNGGKR